MTETITSLVAGQAARHARKVAVVDGTTRLSYRELLARADNLAARLSAGGVGRGVFVGLACVRSARLIIGMLGILRAGAAYVPLDPAYPEERLNFMVADAGIRLVVGDKQSLARLPRGPVQAISVDADWSATSLAPPRQCGDDAAYLIYTSGSTGTPKGVVIPHRGIVRLVAGCDYADLGPQTVIAQMSSPSFDAITFEVWGALANGGRVVVVPQDVLLAPTRLTALLRAESVSTVFVTTALFNTIVTARPDAFATARQVYFGGEVLNPAKVALALDAGVAPRGPGPALHNIYGPTEVTTFATYQRLTSVPDTGGPIGGPISRTRAWVVGDDGQLVGSEPGELWLSGPGVGWGYWRRPGMTADRFVPEPFSGEPGARAYRTGDLVRKRTDGGLEFLGRLDSQAKIRGFRVEPGEIEVALSSHPAVDACVVVVRQPTGDSPASLVGYIQLARDQECNIENLRAFLRRRLPEYLVPGTLVPVRALPLTPNGKIDRERLPVPDTVTPDGEYVPPRTATEEIVAGVWAEVLGSGRIGRLESFFDLGGNSLSAVRIADRLTTALCTKVSATDMFTMPTVAGLARLLDVGGTGPTGDRRIIPDPGRDRRSPLSLIEEEVWFFTKLKPDNIAYHTQISLRVAGPLEVDLIERALTDVVSRQESLRTTFEEDDDGRAWQVVHPPAPVRVHRVDLSHLSDAARRRAVQDLIREQCGRPFDLGALPLFRWTAIRHRPEAYELLLVEHHFVHDGWSFRLLSRELAALYNGYLTGRPVFLATPLVQYADFAGWQCAAAEGAELADQHAYWIGRLADAPPVLLLPGDRSRPHRQSFLGGQVRVDLPGDLAEGLRELCRNAEVSLFAGAYAGFIAWLHRYTGERDLCVGSGFANRRPDTENVIGMFVNTVVLRTQIRPVMRFEDLLRASWETVLGATANQEYPFVRLVRELRPERDLAYNPLFQVMFSFHDAPAPRLDFGGAPVSVFEHANGSAKADLNVIIIPRDGSPGEPVSILWEYSADLFDRSTAERMVAQYVHLLDAVVHDPLLRVWQLSLA